MVFNFGRYRYLTVFCGDFSESVWNYTAFSGDNKQCSVRVLYAFSTNIFPCLLPLCLASFNQVGLWSRAGANCTHLITQSTDTSSREAIGVPKIILEFDSTNRRYPSLNYPRPRIELASVLAIVTSF